jgi:hypothetical protein
MPNIEKMDDDIRLARVRKEIEQQDGVSPQYEVVAPAGEVVQVNPDAGRLTEEEALLYQTKATERSRVDFSEKPTKEGESSAMEIIEDLKGCELSKYIDWERAEKDGDLDAQIGHALVMAGQEDEELQRAQFGDNHPGVLRFLQKHAKYAMPVIGAGLVIPALVDIGMAEKAKSDKMWADIEAAQEKDAVAAVQALDQKQLTDMRFGAYAEAVRGFEERNKGYEVADIKVTPDFRVPGKTNVYISMLVKTPEGKDWLIQRQTQIQKADAAHVIAASGAEAEISSADFRRDLAGAVGTSIKIMGTFKTIDGISEGKPLKTVGGILTIAAGEVVKQKANDIAGYPGSNVQNTPDSTISTQQK